MKIYMRCFSPIFSYFMSYDIARWAKLKVIMMRQCWPAGLSISV